jgi:hypothetical protein
VKDTCARREPPAWEDVGKASPTLGPFGLRLNRREQLIEVDAMEHLRPDAVNNCEGYLGSVLSRIGMHAEGSFAKGRVNNLHDGFRDRANVGVLGHDCGEGFLDLLAITFIWPGFVFGEAVLVREHAGMREVVRAFRETRPAR